MRGWDKTLYTHTHTFHNCGEPITIVENPSQLWRTHHTSSLKPGFHCESSLVPRPSPKSGKRVWFLSDISEQHFLSYQVRSLHEDCPNCILCPGFKFYDGLDCSCNDLKSLIRLLSHLEQERTSCRASLLYLQFDSKYNRSCHVHIITSSAI